MRSEAGLNLVELRIVVVVMIVVGLVAIPAFLTYSGEAKRKQGALDCLLALAKAAEADDAGAACPVAGKPYAPAFACPDPGKHLQPDLALKRVAGAIVLEQGLPPATSRGEFPGAGASLLVESTGPPLQLRIVNGAWYRWVWGPLAGLYFLFMGFISGFEAWDLGPREGVASRTFRWCITVLLVLGAAAAVGYFHRTVRVEIDGGRGRVVRSVRALGLPCGTTVHEGVAGIAALKGSSTFDVVVLKKGGKGFEGVLLFTVPEESLGLAGLCQERFRR